MEMCAAMSPAFPCKPFFTWCRKLAINRRDVAALVPSYLIFCGTAAVIKRRVDPT